MPKPKPKRRERRNEGKKWNMPKRGERILEVSSWNHGTGGIPRDEIYIVQFDGEEPKDMLAITRSQARMLVRCINQCLDATRLK